MGLRCGYACHYCGRELKAHRVTRDHVVPRWVRRLIQDHPWDLRQVVACEGCNRRKGNMPVDVFLRVRFDLKAVKAQHSKWSRIHWRAMTGNLSFADRALIVMAFDPPKVEIGPPAPAGVDWVRGR